jgi:hypothetical protein
LLSIETISFSQDTLNAPFGNITSDHNFTISHLPDVKHPIVLSKRTCLIDRLVGFWSMLQLLYSQHPGLKSGVMM